MKKSVAAMALLFAANAAAADLSQIGTLAQGQFLKLSRDLGAVSAYKGLTPATPLGLTGFDIGAEITQTKLEDAAVFRQAGAGDIGHIVIPKIHIAKGLPAGFDIGAFVGKALAVDGALIGAEVRYAILDDGLATPALGVRLSGSKLIQVSKVNLSTVALDAMLSKKLAFVTPYIGAGSVRVNSSADVAGLHDERFNKSRLFIGMNVNLPITSFALEAEKMGDNTSVSAKVGFRF